MPKVRVTRRLHFSAGHRLHSPDYDDEKNRAVFGACSNPSGHGHNYELDVTVDGEIAPETGYVLDVKRLRDLAGQLDGARLVSVKLWETRRNHVEYCGE
jgi:6-pyruvoyltetrahydropterin/6-carboxytetrahydropterin synthase